MVDVLSHVHLVLGRFSWGLGMNQVAKSDQSTGNSAFASYAVQSGELVFAVTAPYSRACRAANVRFPRLAPEFGFMSSTAICVSEMYPCCDRARQKVCKGASVRSPRLHPLPEIH